LSHRPRWGGPTWIRVSLGTLVLAAATVALSAPASASVPEVAGAPPPLVPPGTVELGAADPATPVSLSVTVASRDPSGMAAAVASVSTPGWPDYRRFLSPPEFASRFGAPAATLATVRSELVALGLHPGATRDDGLSIPVQATVGQASAAFRTSIHKVLLPGGRPAYTDVTTPSYPAGVQAVIGLDTVTRLARQTEASPTTSGVTSAPASSAVLPAQACPTATTPDTRDAAQLSAAYDVGPLYGSGIGGAGQTVALYELAGFSASDVASYQSCYAVSDPVSTVPVDGGAGIGAGTSEVTADIEVVSSSAPEASIVVYEAPNGGSGIYDDWARIVNDDTAKVVSTSWGLCEARLSQADPAEAQAEQALFAQAALQGQSVLAATGDSGSEGCDQPGYADSSLGVEDPASQPDVVAVGGTDLSQVSSPPVESVWNSSEGASGGGVSSLWPMPSWQDRPGVVGAGSSGAPCGAGAGYCRQIPDVSAAADPTYGYPVYCTAGDCASAGWVSAGGTSLATPYWASLVSLVDEACGAPVGFLDPALYNDASSSPTVFHDVTAGNNDYLGAHGGTYPAGPGYDMATGLGTPDAGRLASALCPGWSPGGSPHPSGSGAGYRMAASDGGVFAFGHAGFYGSTGALRLTSPVVGMASTPDGHGYWLVASDGGIFSFGDAGFFGSMGDIRLNRPVVGMASTPDGQGYWLVASDGGIFSFGDAVFYGSTGRMALNRPIVGMASTPDGHGYWLVASDGGIFSFGDAVFRGSTGNLVLNRPIVGMAADAGTGGYWLVASDGGIFSFDAPFHGSTGNLVLNRPIVGMGSTG
jgi:subtilase family serine protease